LIYFTNGPAGAWNTIWNVGTAANENGQLLFTNATYLNTTEDPMIGGISYANDGVLDPRPQAGSPAYDDVLGGAPMAVTYRGAFSGPGDNWADGWTALSTLGYLAPAMPAPPVLGITVVEGNEVDLIWPTVSGMSYQLQFKSSISAEWTDAGATIDGTGNPVTITQPVSAAEGYFRLEVQ
jgi:hypothetical protein